MDDRGGLRRELIPVFWRTRFRGQWPVQGWLRWRGIELRQESRHVAAANEDFGLAGPDIRHVDIEVPRGLSGEVQDIARIEQIASVWRPIQAGVRGTVLLQEHVGLQAIGFTSQTWLLVCDVPLTTLRSTAIQLPSGDQAAE